MSVSMKDRRAVIYGEVERLRSLLDQRDQQIASQTETIRRRDAQLATRVAEVKSLYAEREELSAALDFAKQQHRATCAELSAEKAAHADTYARLKELERAPQPSAAPLSERGARNEVMKRLAITCGASVKWIDGAGFRQYKDGNWVAIPTHTIEFVSKGITA